MKCHLLELRRESHIIHKASYKKHNQFHFLTASILWLDTIISLTASTATIHLSRFHFIIKNWHFMNKVKVFGNRLKCFFLCERFKIWSHHSNLSLKRGIEIRRGHKNVTFPSQCLRSDTNRNRRPLIEIGSVCCSLSGVSKWNEKSSSLPSHTAEEEKKISEKQTVFNYRKLQNMAQEPIQNSTLIVSRFQSAVSRVRDDEKGTFFARKSVTLHAWQRQTSM